jgi:MFS family permease
MSPSNMVLTLAVANQTAVQAARVLLALYLLDLGGSPVVVGLLAATFSACPALLSVSMGKLSDRIGARKPMMAGSLVACTGMLLPYFFPGIPVIFLAAVLVGMVTSIANVSLQSLVGLFSTPENRTRNFSNYSMANASASLLGPLIAGFTIDHAGHAPACLIIAAMLASPLAILGASRMPLRGEAPRESHRKGRFADLVAAPGLRRTLATGSMQNVADSLYMYYMPVYAHSIGLSASAIGIVLAMNAAAAFVIRFTLPGLMRRLGEARLLVSAFSLGATALILIPFFQNAVVLGMISFMFGLGLGATGPMVNMMMFANSPPGRSGEAMGLKVTVNHFTKVVSPIILGSVAGMAGLPAVFWLIAGLMGTVGWVNRPGARATRASRSAS